MAQQLYGQGVRASDPARIPLHLRHQSQKQQQQQQQQQALRLGEKNTSAALDGDGFHARKRFPDHLHFNPNALRLRSRTESTHSSISSAYIPDSATTYSLSSLASPLSSSYANDLQERFAVHSLEPSRPSSRIRHRHQPSSATTCSTFINDDGDAPIVVGYPDIASKLRDLYGGGCFVDDEPPVQTPSVQ